MISFTFDDGRANHVTPGAAILEEFGFKGTFYVCPGLVGDKRYAWERPAHKVELASWSEIVAVASRGHEVGNHSWNHPSFPYASKRKRATPHWMDRQVVKSAETIRMRIPDKRFSWAWPYHWSVTPMTNLIKEHHTGIRPHTNRCGYNSSGPVLEQMNGFVDMLLKEALWGCAIIHDLSTGFNPLSPDVFRMHLEYVARRGIEVRTVSEALLAQRP